jgi:hypothetical protein
LILARGLLMFMVLAAVCSLTMDSFSPGSPSMLMILSGFAILDRANELALAAPEAEAAEELLVSAAGAHA